MADAKGESEESEHFPIEQTKCMDIKEAMPGVQDGDEIEVYVHATWGKTEQGNHTVVYKEGSPVTTTFNAHGTTLNFHVQDEDKWWKLNQYERFARGFAGAFV